MLRCLTEETIPHDYRLKVLWIEDKLPAKISSALSRHFTVWRAWRPDEVSYKLKKQLAEIYLQRGEAKAYRLPDFPFDGFLSDFNLIGAGLDAESRLESDSEDESRAASDEEINQELGDLAKEAEAAGLSAAVLTALNFDSHPAVVVPYTAYQEQLSKQRAIILLLAPPSLVISKVSELDLGKESLESKLQQFSEDYRINLTLWAGNNVVSIPSGERQRLLDLAKARTHGSNEESQVKWEVGDHIVVDTIYGRRRLSCGSLWYRFDGGTPSFTEVEEWINKIPVPKAVYSAAVRLASEYWQYSETEISRYRYTLSRLIRSLGAASGVTAENTKTDVKLLCELLGINFESAISSPEIVKMGQNKFVEHLLSSGETKEVMRLAVFMLLTMEYAARWASVQEETDDLWKLRRIIDVVDQGMADRPLKTFDEINVDKINGIDMVRLKQVMDELGYSGLAVEKGELLLHRLTVRDEDMAQRLDPIPEKLLTTEQDFSGERVFVGLRRNGINLKALIANTDAGGIQPDERKEVQQFARDIGYPPSDWPEWLRKNYV